ncbi:MAG: roadblock/LC7 domain-containing protein [Limisphaerales bacterium]
MKPANPPPAALSPAPKPMPPSARVPTVAAAHPPAQVDGKDMIRLPLNDILARLPEAVAPLVLRQPGGTLSLPASMVMNQLRTGVVRIPLGQLRQGSPAGTFSTDLSHDDSLIALPLPLVLAAVGPAMLVRRGDQKTLDLPPEVTGVFGPLTAPVADSAPAATPPESAAPTTPVPPAPKPISPPPAPKPMIAAAAPPATPKPVVPPMPKPVLPASAVPAFPKPVLPRPGLPKPIIHPPFPFASSKTTSPMPFVTTRPAAPALPVAADVVVTTLGEICDAWPDEIRKEIDAAHLRSASVSIPLSRLEGPMKTGRVLFGWSELTRWLATPPASPSPHGRTGVELPLKVVAPLFMARRRGTVQKKVALGEDIPDLFAGSAKPAAQPSAEPGAPEEAPPVDKPAPPETRAEDNVLGKAFGQPAKTDWSLQEIAQGITALPNVAYAILATDDGLLVAGNAPAPLNASTLAAFLPQIFGRAARSAAESQLGTLERLTLTINRAPHLVFKAGVLFLAVAGQPGLALPETALRDIAGQLAKSKE